MPEAYRGNRPILFVIVAAGEPFQETVQVAMNVLAIAEVLEVVEVRFVDPVSLFNFPEPLLAAEMPQVRSRADDEIVRHEEERRRQLSDQIDRCEQVLLTCRTDY